MMIIINSVMPFLSSYQHITCSALTPVHDAEQYSDTCTKLLRTFFMTIRQTENNYTNNMQPRMGTNQWSEDPPHFAHFTIC